MYVYIVQVCKWNKKHELNAMTSLLYADDTVLMSESPEELQRELNKFHEYCTTWKLKVNVEKN
jgi:hypothetical protein